MTLENFSIGGDGFAGKDDELIARLDFRPRDHFFRSVGKESGSGRSKGEETLEGAGEFIFRALFDPLTGEDEGRDGSGGIKK